MDADDGIALLIAAADFAADRHRSQKRKGSRIPYVNHPLRVARVLSDEGHVRDAEILAAAILHDTVEDTATSSEELREVFGERVARIVGEVTDDKSLSKVERKRQQVVHAREISTEARMVKLADKLSNLRDLVERPLPSWSATRVRGYFAWAWHVVDALGDASPPLRAELDRLFAGDVPLGDAMVRAVPESEAERTRVLDDYYRMLEGVSD